MNALTPVGTSHRRLPVTASAGEASAGTLDLRALRYFAAAARTGNLGRAAQELHVTPPAISQQLRKLEDELGTQLLIRHSRGVTTTPAGSRLLERIDTILQLISTPLDPEQAAVPVDGTVSLAVPAEIGAILAAPLIAEMRRRWPRLTLDLQESPGSGSETRLLGRQIDIALLADPADLDELRIEPLLTESLGLVVSPGGALGRNSLPLRLRDLAGVPLILPNPRHWIRRALAKAGFQRGVVLDTALQVDSLAMSRAMVREGQGCTILPAVAVRDELARGALVFRPIEQPALSTVQAIGFRRMAPPVVGEIAKTIGNVITGLVTTGAWPGARSIRSPAEPIRPAAARGEVVERWLEPSDEPMRGTVEFAEGD